MSVHKIISCTQAYRIFKKSEFDMRELIFFLCSSYLINKKQGKTLSNQQGKENWYFFNIIHYQKFFEDIKLMLLQVQLNQQSIIRIKYYFMRCFKLFLIIVINRDKVGIQNLKFIGHISCMGMKLQVIFKMIFYVINIDEVYSMLLDDKTYIVMLSTKFLGGIFGILRSDQS